VSTSLLPPPTASRAASEPLAQSPAAPLAEEQHRQEEGSPRGGWLAAILLMPPWLISAVVHINLILLLALWTYSLATRETERTLVAALPDAEVFLEEVEVAATLQADASPVAVPMNDAAGMAALGEIPQAELAEAGDRLAADTAPEDLELGQLFGREGSGMTTIGLGPGAGAGAEFFGVKAKGKSFFFVVDASNSMKRGKFEAAKRELLAAVKRLKPEQSFYVIFFNREAHRMFDAENPEPRAIRASPTNIGKLQRWMEDFPLGLATNPLEAVKFARSRMPDAIYILSDGKFTDRGRTEEWLKANNIIDDPIVGYGPKVVIHTIGFYSRDGEATLQEIAKRYKGTYRFVPAP
jgi:hypothetical protein